MAFVQYYTTTLIDPANGRQFGFVSIPRRSLKQPDILDFPSDDGQTHNTEMIARLLGISGKFIPIAELPDEITQMLLSRLNSWDAWLDPPGPEITTFMTGPASSERLAFTPVIPFEQSPLSLASLAELAAKAAAYATNPIALGIFLGTITAGTTSLPLIIVTVPAGIVLCSGAVMLAKIMDEKRDQLAQLMGIAPVQTATFSISPSREALSGQPPAIEGASNP